MDSGKLQCPMEVLMSQIFPLIKENVKKNSSFLIITKELPWALRKKFSTIFEFIFLEDPFIYFSEHPKLIQTKNQKENSAKIFTIKPNFHPTHNFHSLKGIICKKPSLWCESNLKIKQKEIQSLPFEKLHKTNQRRIPVKTHLTKKCPDILCFYENIVLCN